MISVRLIWMVDGWLGSLYSARWLVWQSGLFGRGRLCGWRVSCTDHRARSTGVRCPVLGRHCAACHRQEKLANKRPHAAASLTLRYSRYSVERRAWKAEFRARPTATGRERGRETRPTLIKHCQVWAMAQMLPSRSLTLYQQTASKRAPDRLGRLVILFYFKGRFKQTIGKIFRDDIRVLKIFTPVATP